MRMMVIIISLGAGRINYMFVEEAAADKKDQKLIIIAEELMDRLFVLLGPAPDCWRLVPMRLISW